MVGCPVCIYPRPIPLSLLVCLLIWCLTQSGYLWNVLQNLCCLTPHDVETLVLHLHSVELGVWAPDETSSQIQNGTCNPLICPTTKWLILHNQISNEPKPWFVKADLVMLSDDYKYLEATTLKATPWKIKLDKLKVKHWKATPWNIFWMRADTSKAQAKLNCVLSLLMCVEVLVAVLKGINGVLVWHATIRATWCNQLQQVTDLSHLGSPCKATVYAASNYYIQNQMYLLYSLWN